MRLPEGIKAVIRKPMTKLGLFWNPAIRADPQEFCAFKARAIAIRERHDNQSPETIKALALKYEKPMFGEIEVYRLMELLAQCIDPTNNLLFCTSQLTHTLHVMEGLHRAGITDRTMLIAGLVHDLGKLALITGEAPEYIEGAGKLPIGPHEPGRGLDNALLTWDHGEISYARLKPYISEDCGWLVRYHSIAPPCLKLMDARDRALRARYYDSFHAIDKGYSFFRVPKVQLADYKDFLQEVFPKPIVF